MTLVEDLKLCNHHGHCRYHKFWHKFCIWNHLRGPASSLVRVDLWYLRVRISFNMQGIICLRRHLRITLRTGSTSSMPTSRRSVYRNTSTAFRAAGLNAGLPKCTVLVLCGWSACKWLWQIRDTLKQWDDETLIDTWNWYMFDEEAMHVRASLWSSTVWTAIKNQETWC